MFYIFHYLYAQQLLHFYKFWWNKFMYLRKNANEIKYNINDRKKEEEHDNKKVWSTTITDEDNMRIKIFYRTFEFTKDGKKMNKFKNIFDEQLMVLIHHILVCLSTFVEMLTMKPKLNHQSKLNIFVRVEQLFLFSLSMVPMM